MTIDAAEIEYFNRHSSKWWDENGPFAPLHRMNPFRLEYIKKQITAHFKEKDFQSLRILDIGCGGGLIAEEISKEGAIVYGLDADEQAIKTAKKHAEEQDLTIHYQYGTIEDLQQTDKEAFDVIIALEIVEHVSDLDQFIRLCLPLAKENGLLIFSTVNRTPKSFALGIVAAEYIFKWVEPGTHSWQKFVKPSELSRALRASNAEPVDITGLTYQPLSKEFSLSPTDISMNYFLSAKKKGA